MGACWRWATRGCWTRRSRDWRGSGGDRRAARTGQLRRASRRAPRSPRRPAGNWQISRSTVWSGDRWHPSEAVRVPSSETIALDGIAWGDIVWTRPAAVPLDLNGPVDRPFARCPVDFTERAILDLLRQAAAPDPNATAIVGTTERLTYAELVDRVGRIAKHVAAAVPAGGAVATLLPNSPSGFAALLGCLIAARVCIVLDPSHPRERNAA